MTDRSTVTPAPKRVNAVERLRLTVVGLAEELTGSWRLAADLPSFARYVRDTLAYRVRRVVNVGDSERLRTVRFKDGTALTYRLDRGDIRAIAETWMAGAYELPIEIRSRNVLDLGANIGSTSVWLARRYGAAKVVAVEPVPGNARLLRINLEQNDINAEVVEAAVGTSNGTAKFAIVDGVSTWGRLGEEGIEVKLVTPESLVGRFPAGELIDLVKLDIEGAEGELFEGDLRWLDRVRCVVAEFHADVVDVQSIVAKLDGLGFTRMELAEDNVYLGLTDVMAAFVRSSVAAVG